MPKTQVDVDAALLAHAQELLGFDSGAHTVDRALADLIARHRRQEAIEAEIACFATGRYVPSPAAARPGTSGGRA